MTSIVLTSIVAFTVIILLLVVILLVAQAKLVQQGDVKIIVNGDEKNPLIAAAGTSLLSTLSGQKIFLPSACGVSAKYWKVEATSFLQKLAI